jgi:hypothetical protein
MQQRPSPSDPLTAAVEAIVAERRAAPFLSPGWVASEAMRLLAPGDRAAALIAGAELAARDALNQDYDGAHRRRYPVWREGELVFLTLDLLSPGEIVDLAHGLRAQGRAALQHADVIEAWQARPPWQDRPHQGEAAE